MRITLPVPPSANRYWRVYRGMVCPSKEAKKYKETVKNLARLVAFGKTSEPCVVCVRWFRERKSGDLDNRLKVVLDALQGIAYDSDSQVVELHAWRDEDKDDPRVEIEVTTARAA